MDNTISIYNKIFNIIIELNGVNQNGYNSFHKYKYIKQEDIINAIKPLLIKNKLVITSEVIEEETIEIKDKGMFTKVTLEFTITDLDSMAQTKQIYRGNGIDVGDKGIYKAMTGAEKYFYMKNFLIGTGNDDPEYNGIDEMYINNNANNKGGNNNNKNNKQYNSTGNNNNNINKYNNGGNPRANINDNTSRNNDIKNNDKINKLPTEDKKTDFPIELKNKNGNKEIEEDSEPRIDERLQKLLFVASNQEKDIVLNAIKKLGYTSTSQVKVKEYKKVLELIKAQVKLLK